MSDKPRYDFERTSPIDQDTLFRGLATSISKKIEFIHNSDTPIEWVIKNRNMRPQLAYERFVSLYEYITQTEKWDANLYNKYREYFDSGKESIKEKIRYLTENYDIETEHRYFPYALDEKAPTLVPKPKKLNRTGELMRQKREQNEPIRLKVIEAASKIMADNPHKPLKEFVTDKENAKSSLYGPLMNRSEFKEVKGNIRNWLNEAIKAGGI